MYVDLFVYMYVFVPNMFHEHAHMMTIIAVTFKFTAK